MWSIAQQIIKINCFDAQRRIIIKKISAEEQSITKIYIEYWSEMTYKSIKLLADAVNVDYKNYLPKV